jgi:hypothetical protein
MARLDLFLASGLPVGDGWESGRETWGWPGLGPGCCRMGGVWLLQNATCFAVCDKAGRRKASGSVFFSEEKNQKTFDFCASG